MPDGAVSCALVDLDAIRQNVRALRDHARGAGLMAVVKADGYGHGMLPVARAALEAGASWIGVAQLGEALALRAAGITAPVLAWLTVPGDRVAEAVAAGVDIGVGSTWALAEVAEAARMQAVVARVHLKVDTGMGRGGATPGDWPDLLASALRLRAEGLVAVVGVFSHLACADTPDHPANAAQVAAFTAAVAQARAGGADPELCHLANSAGTIAVPAARFDLVRTGIALYGLSPLPQLAGSPDLGLRPAMTLMGRIAMVKDVPAGQGVSYGLTYTTSTPTTLAVVPLGYGDGLPRHAGGRGQVLVGGRRVTIAGRVCMDQVVLDVGAAGGSAEGGDGRAEDGLAVDGRAVRVGDVAVLFGPGADGEPTAQDWADVLGTISYEIVTRLGSRVPRQYLGTEYLGAQSLGTEYLGTHTAYPGGDTSAPTGVHTPTGHEIREGSR